MLKIIALPFIFLIKVYQVAISPLFGPMCRFEPSCSQYAIDAFTKYGVFKGMYLAARRIARCHPFNPGGYDPVE